MNNNLYAIRSRLQADVSRFSQAVANNETYTIIDTDLTYHKRLEHAQDLLNQINHLIAKQEQAQMERMQAEQKFASFNLYEALMNQ